MAQYNDGWFSTAELDKILREVQSPTYTDCYLLGVFMFCYYHLLLYPFRNLQENIQFTTNLDVTTFTNGQRETHNPVGRAFPSVVWDFYQVQYNRSCQFVLF